MERKGFVLKPKFVFIDGRTGATLHSETMPRGNPLHVAAEHAGAVVLLRADGPADPDFLGALSTQKIRGTRILLQVEPAVGAPCRGRRRCRAEAGRATLIPLHRAIKAVRRGWRRSGNVFAIIQSGGRQVKVDPGHGRHVDRIEAEPGNEVTIDRILFLEKDGGEMLAGAPFVANAKVIGVVDGEARGPKIRMFKKKRRKGFRKTQGHRSTYTRVRITGIDV